MTDKQIIEVLKDEFGEYDAMVFCQLYSRFCELADFIDREDIDFDITYYKEKSNEIRTKIVES